MPGVLHGLKVLDFTALLPGPYATMMLSDLGAEVLRIEAPNRPDLLRAMKPQRDGISAAHAHLNRGKRSLALDLKNPKAHDLILQLLEKGGFDVIIEGFRPGTMKKLGLDYESLAAKFPRLIYCSLSGYGQTGPDAQKAGHDINYLAKAGVSSYSGRRGSGPAALGIQLADMAGGSCHSVISILAAVIHRQNTGEGQHCDVSICDGTLSLNALYGSGFLETERDPSFEALELNGGTLYDYYECEDGRFLSFGALEPQFIQNFFAGLGRLDLLQSLSQDQTPKNLIRIKAEVKKVVATKPLAAWMEIYADKEACVEAVMQFTEIAQDPQFVARDMVVCLKDAEGRQWRQFGSPFKFSKTPVQCGSPGGNMGSDNQHTIEGILGLGNEAYQDLQAEGVFGK